MLPAALESDPGNTAIYTVLVLAFLFPIRWHSQQADSNCPLKLFQGHMGPVFLQGHLLPVPSRPTLLRLTCPSLSHRRVDIALPFCGTFP